MLPVTVQRPPLRAGTGAIPSLVGRGLRFLNLYQMETHTGSPLEIQIESELPGMEQERGLAYLLPLLVALEGTAQSLKTGWLNNLNG